MGCPMALMYACFKARTIHSRRNTTSSELSDPSAIVDISNCVNYGVQDHTYFWSSEGQWITHLVR